jgi:anti-sigma factor RsiW
MTMHDQWIDQLSDYLDDELPQRERQAVERHLAECADCRQTLHELQRVVATAGSLPAQAPATDLWSGIADRLDPRVVPFDRGRRRFAFTLPELAAAAVLLATLSGGTVALLMMTADNKSGATGSATAPAAPANAVVDSPRVSDVPPDSGIVSAVSLGDVQYEAAVTDLERALEAGRGRLDDTTIAVVEQNLSIIDRAIAEARSALAADPSNGYLSGHLVEARRRKLELLRRTATLVAEAN